MPQFTVLICTDGPVIDVAVAVGWSWRRRLVVQGVVVPSPMTVRALIDTGSDLSVVHPQVLQQLGVPEKGWIRIRRPGTGGGFRLAALSDVRLSIAAPSGNTRGLDPSDRSGPLRANGLGVDRSGCFGVRYGFL
jgi:hypothetical protein